jgi:hypothetical protein
LVSLVNLWNKKGILVADEDHLIQLGKWHYRNKLSSLKQKKPICFCINDGHNNKNSFETQQFLASILQDLFTQDAI